MIILIINGKEVVGNTFAYDGCHKIYINESREDEELMIDYGYEILPIHLIEEAFKNSCGLRFINNTSLSKSYVKQFEDMIIEF